MALRFQAKDEIDKKVEESGGLWRFFWGVVFVVIAVATGISALFTGKTLKEYGQDIGIWLACVLLVAFIQQILSPLYEEFSLRTKEINGRVSAIEEAVNASKKSQAELLDRLTAIEEKLTEIQSARRV